MNELEGLLSAERERERERERVLVVEKRKVRKCRILCLGKKDKIGFMEKNVRLI